jgi:iron complex transport system substrate-binding protein
MTSKPQRVSRLSRRSLLGAGFALVAPSCREKAPASGVARRVISLSPSTTETVFALGAGARLVGRSRYCDYPAEAARVPVVGGFVDASFETILGLVPDLVVGVRGPGGRALHDRLNARGIATYFPATDSMSEIDAMLRGVAERLGERTSGESLVNAIGAARSAIAARLEQVNKPRALLVFGIRPIVVAGSDGFAGEMLALAGAQNAAPAGTRYPALGIEQLLALDPDIVLDATGAATHEGEGFSGDLPGWRELRALKQGHLVHIRDERVLRPGPRIAGGLAVLARAIHPEIVFDP